MLHQQISPAHQHSPNSRDILWKLRIALFGKGLHPRSSTGKRELVRPPPIVRAPAKVISSRRQRPAAKIITLFTWCGPELRLSDEGMHAGNWPSIHGSSASSARVSSSNSPGGAPRGNQSTPPETVAHEQQHRPQQPQQVYTVPQTPAETAVATAAATLCSGSGNPAAAWHGTATASVQISTVKRSREPHLTPSGKLEARSSKAQASFGSGNEPVSTSTSSSSANKRTCNIHPDDIAIIARIFRCSPAAVMNLCTQQQQHMMAYAQCVVQQRPLHFLDDDSEESQAECQHKQQQHRRITSPQPAPHAPQHQQPQQFWAISARQPGFQPQHNTSAQQQEHQQFHLSLQQQQRPPWAQNPLTYGILEPYWRPIKDLEPAYVPERRRRTTSEIMRMRVEVGFNFHAIR